ncbi:SpoVG family protein [Telmatocola sphagniphila]|uniref:SpoVG family protein n=1 Tax=Telmatocola sphagniphila TaxID=1123043 RepID=A0A8E6B9Q1_9BACT|nr:SpoVG family protein [Telmatocola sphagniphila]
MTITEVRIKLVEENNERLLGFCSITIDNAFVIRDLKIIEGTRGLFVAMPSRKLTDRCHSCGSKNHLKSRFCNFCGHKLDELRAGRDMDGRVKLHADIAHPIHSSCRETMQAAIIKSFHAEKELAKKPGYVCRYDDFDGGDYDSTSVSYQDVVSEVARAGFRTHPGHAPRGPHTNPADKSVATNRDDFASGL